MFDEDKIDFAPVPISIESRFIWSSDKLIEARLAPCFALVLPSTHTVKELRMINLFIRLKTREDIFSYIIWIIGLHLYYIVFKFIGYECNVTKTSVICWVLHKIYNSLVTICCLDLTLKNTFLWVEFKKVFTEVLPLLQHPKKWPFDRQQGCHL